MRFKLILLFFILVYCSAAPIRKISDGAENEINNVINPVKFFPNRRIVVVDNIGNGYGSFDEEMFIYGNAEGSGEENGSGAEDFSGLSYVDDFGSGYDDGSGTFDDGSGSGYGDGSGTFDDGFGSGYGYGNNNDNVPLLGFSLFPSLDFSVLTKDNRAYEMFYRDWSSGNKDGPGKKHSLPPPSIPENVVKKTKIDSDNVVNGENDEVETALLSPGILEPPQVEECYFAQLRTTEDETKPRSKQSEVSTECSGTNLLSFQQFINTEIDLFGTTNVAQIILERGAGEFDLDFEDAEVINEIGNRKLCQRHYEELYSKWNTRNYNHILKSQRNNQKKPVCSMDNRYNPHQLAPFVDKNFVKVTSRQASTFLKKTGILLHVGLPVCQTHGISLEKILAENIVEEDGFSIVPTFDDFGSSPSISRPVDEDSCVPSDGEPVPAKCSQGTYSESSSSPSQGSSNDPAFKPRQPKLPLITPHIDVSTEIQEAFYAFAKTTGQNRYKLLVDFESLQRRTKQKKACLFRSFMDIIATIMAGDKKTMLITLAHAKNSRFDWQKNPDKQMEKALGYVRVQYNAAESRDGRLNVVAQVAHLYPLAAIQKAIPGLSPRFYAAARKLAKQRLECPDSPGQKRKSLRFNKFAAMDFIAYVTSPQVSTMLPSAHITVKSPDGKRTTLPPVMRRFHDGEIISMYEKHCEEEGYSHADGPGYSASGLSEYVMRSILKVCSAKRQKSLQCVDYFLAYGQEAFSTIKKALTTLLRKSLIDQQWHDDLEFGLQESENYLKTDYYTQTKLQSRIGDLCLTFALSDPNMKEFRSVHCTKLNSASHDHDLQTDRIRLFDRTIIDIRDTLNQLIGEATDPSVKEDLSELRDDVFKSEKEIMEWKKHIVRAKYSNHLREEIIAGLKEGDALVTVDYATRYIPTKHIEMQSDFFGKKGLSWHISHVFTVINDMLVQHTMVHLMDEEDQNGQAVIAILTDVLTRLKKLDISTVTIRSDNAGYYKNAQVLVSLPVIAEEIGITLGRYSFSESQSGKAEADREAGRMKRRMNFASHQGFDILNGIHMLNAITSGSNPLPGLTVVVAKLNYVNVNKKAAIPLISNLHDFVYTKGKIRYWKHFNIGSGKEIEQKSFEDCVIRPTLTVTYEWDRNPEDKSYTFWMKTKEEKQDKGPKAAKSNDQNEIAHPEEYSGYTPTKLFSCPVGNCEKQYEKEGNLHIHLIRGDHKFAVEKFTLQEFAFKLYQNHLEGFAETRKSSLNQRALETEAPSQEDQPVMGWALKTSKRGARYTSDMKIFLDEEWAVYYNQQKKPDVKEVEHKMATARTADNKRRFSPDQRLSAHQIAAYYKRKADILREQMENLTLITDEEQEAVSDRIIQEMNDETGEIEIEYEDHSMFVNDNEEMLECVQNQYANSEQGDNELQDPDIDDLYADEEELESLYELPKECRRKQRT